MWRGLVARWRSSGQTAREFASRQGVNASTLSFWAWRLKREGNGVREPDKRMVHVPTMIEVRARAAADDRFEIEVGGRRVHVPPSFDEEALLRLLDVLEGAR